jgi:ubiquinol-cytochrome c reductase cytochrome c subunit
MKRLLRRRGQPRTREAAARSWLIRGALLAALLLQVGFSFGAGTSNAEDAAVLERGRTLYETNCTTCHGRDGGGTALGPSLRLSGTAGVDFMLTTGRMPLSNPHDQPMRGEPAFSPDEIDALVAYIASIVPGGPPIPDVRAERGTLPEGAEVFLNNCAACHGAGASGDSVGGGQIAPSLGEATSTQIGEAVRFGPGVMPRFGDETISARELDSLAAYLEWLRDEGPDAGKGANPAEGGLQLGRVGAVAEGLVAVVIGLGVLVLVTRLTGGKT